MPPPGCPSCYGKWGTGGGVCTVCRTVDRIAAYVRGPQIPADSSEQVLLCLRTWLGELQDFSEIARGVVPRPGGIPLITDPDLPLNRPGGPGEDPPVKGAFPKAAGVKQESSPTSAEGADTAAGEEPPAPAVAPGLLGIVLRKGKRRSRRPRRRRKDKRKPRSRQRREEPRLASPVRPEGVTRSRSDSREEIRRRKARPRSPIRPRSPAYSPPRRRSPTPVAPSYRPEGRHWQGPIRAPPREPPLGQGRRFGKNKGTSKRKRNKELWRRQGRARGRR